MIVNFLDTTLSLNTGTHEPCNKANHNPLYINISSNHPPNIIKNFPENMQKKISKLSSSTSIFSNSYIATHFLQADFNRIKFEQGNTSTTSSRNRKSNKIWFNPPWKHLSAKSCIMQEPLNWSATQIILRGSYMKQILTERSFQKDFREVRVYIFNQIYCKP